MVQTRITTEWLLEGFKYELEATSRPKTVEYYCGHVQRFLRWAKGAGIPQEAHLIDKRHIQSFFHHLLQETETAVAGNGSRRGLQRTERTRWPYYRSLRRFFEWAIKEGYLEESGESPVIVVDGPRRCSARGGFRTVDLPLGEDSSTIGPALLLHVPQEPTRDTFVVGYRVGASPLRLMGEKIASYQGLQRRPRRCPNS